ncbi:mRNA capping enzyme-domain-containing protein [Lipomyces kononenkoae]|uniref:mRNA capping enzyme-domain-containing protein n=1 Tax=Lipomyces kononenkoae TaxID=34357 RepID=A0ACC3SVD6_LIPKO
MPDQSEAIDVAAAPGDDEIAKSTRTTGSQANDVHKSTQQQSSSSLTSPASGSTDSRGRLTQAESKPKMQAGSKRKTYDGGRESTGAADANSHQPVARAPHGDKHALPGPSSSSISERPPEPKSPPRSPPRKLKRPSAAARRTHEAREQDVEKHRRMEVQESQRMQTELSRRSVDSVVRQHYNARPDQGVAQRQYSPIIKLKSFNNFIKSVIIKRFANRNDVVLDLGCGKGGDLLKWDIAGIRGYIGIDVADVSINQAMERYKNMRRRKFWAEFFAGDAFGTPLGAYLPRDMVQQVFPVDIVSMQFCMHYAFETEQKARQLLENVSKSLRRGGKFIGTIPSSDAVIDHIAKLPEGKKEWGNSVYSVRFYNDPPRDGIFRPPFGQRYSFFLEDAVEDVPEYVVPFEIFRAMAEDYKLELIYRKGFHDVFEDETSEHPELFDICRRMGVTKQDGSYGIEGDQREAAGFYLAFAFEKLAG